MKPQILLDSSLWIELFSKGSHYRGCQTAMESGTIVGVPTIIVFEVCKKITSKINAEAALSAAGFLRQFKLLPLTDEIALHAVDLSIEWKLGMADSLVLAHSIKEHSTLITLDNDFRGVSGAKVIK